MITIANISPKAQAATSGVCLYEVRVGSSAIVRFRHRRSQGLSTCLERASHAVKLADAASLEKLLEMVSQSAPPVTKKPKKTKAKRRAATKQAV